MTNTAKPAPGSDLLCSRAELDAARSEGNPHQIALAAANLGFALFEARQFREGVDRLEEAVNTASHIQDTQLQAHCLAIKSFAYQAAGRLPDAYKAAVELLELAESSANDGMRCDALSSQGQILLDSGDSVAAFDRFQEARKIAAGLGDTRRLMNVLGALGSYSLAIAAADQAEMYFDKAHALALSLGDRQAEHGFLGNRAILLAWNGLHVQATADFERVLAYAAETGNLMAQISALRHLVASCGQLDDQERTLLHARRGLELTEASDYDARMAFYEAIILACYRTDRLDAAEEMTRQAISLARSIGDVDKETNLLVSLGESAMLSDRPEQALAAYSDALPLAIRLKRWNDEAYLTGRIAAALGELGRIDEAISHHYRALELARHRDLADLQGEQLSLLAIAHLDRHELTQARTLCAEGVEVLTAAGIEDKAESARRLLAEIDRREQCRE